MDDWTEEQLHKKIVQVLELTNLRFTHYPAGGDRPWYSAKKMKAMGSKSGYPDFYIANPCPDPPAWSEPWPTWVELKTKGGKLSRQDGLKGPGQYERISMLERIGHPCFVAFGYHNFFEKLEWCGYDVGDHWQQVV